jgi:hypothetical protein
VYSPKADKSLSVASTESLLVGRFGSKMINSAVISIPHASRWTMAVRPQAARLPHHRDSSVIGSSQCGGNITAIDGGHIRGGLERQRLGQKCLRHIVGRHFPAKQVPLHVVLFAEAARAGA